MIELILAVVLIALLVALNATFIFEVWIKKPEEDIDISHRNRGRAFSIVFLVLSIAIVVLFFKGGCF